MEDSIPHKWKTLKWFLLFPVYTVVIYINCEEITKLGNVQRIKLLRLLHAYSFRINKLIK